jgi:hypothetical protein
MLFYIIKNTYVCDVYAIFVLLMIIIMLALCMLVSMGSEPRCKKNCCVQSAYAKFLFIIAVAFHNGVFYLITCTTFYGVC